MDQNPLKMDQNPSDMDGNPLDFTQNWTNLIGFWQIPNGRIPNYAEIPMPKKLRFAFQN